MVCIPIFVIAWHENSRLAGLLVTARVAKVMFLHASVILSTQRGDVTSNAPWDRSHTLDDTPRDVTLPSDVAQKSHMSRKCFLSALKGLQFSEVQPL